MCTAVSSSSDILPAGGQTLLLRFLPRSNSAPLRWPTAYEAVMSVSRAPAEEVLPGRVGFCVWWVLAWEEEEHATGCGSAVECEVLLRNVWVDLLHLCEDAVIWKHSVGVVKKQFGSSFYIHTDQNKNNLYSRLCCAPDFLFLWSTCVFNFTPQEGTNHVVLSVPIAFKHTNPVYTRILLSREI